MEAQASILDIIIIEEARASEFFIIVITWTLEPPT